MFLFKFINFTRMYLKYTRKSLLRERSVVNHVRRAEAKFHGKLRVIDSTLNAWPHNKDADRWTDHVAT